MNIKRTNKLKTNSSGFGHIEMLLLVVAVVVIGGVGFFVYNNSNKKTASKSTAHAGGYTTLGSTNGITASACKTYTNIWGGIYSVKVLITKKATTPAYTYDVLDINGITNAISQRTYSYAYYAGTVAAVTINMSVVNKDRIEIYYGTNGWNEIFNFTSTVAGTIGKNINNITTC